jgi:uncharacterized protein (DUF433 family)
MSRACKWLRVSGIGVRDFGRALACIMRAELTMLDWSTCAAVERHPEKVSGAWLFRGTRVPVSALFSNLEGGATVNEFLEWFPGVTREQVNLVLEHASGSLSDPA